MDVASYRDQLEVLDSSSCMTALSSSTSGLGRQQQQPQQQQRALDRIVILKYGPCTMCADQRHQPEQLSLLCDTLESSGFEVVLQRYNLPNRLEVWVDGEQVFVLCDLRRISRANRNAALTCQTILSILQQ